MSVQGDLRFLGTGNRVRPDYQPRLSRDPGRRGIQRSGTTRYSEFQDVNRELSAGNLRDLGRRAAEIQRIIPSGKRVDLLA